MNVDTSKPHLLFTNMGIGGNDSKAYVCESFVGRIKTGEQKINLGERKCLSIGGIMHETLHALGMLVQLQKKKRPSVNFQVQFMRLCDGTGTLTSRYFMTTLRRDLVKRTLGRRAWINMSPATHRSIGTHGQMQC